MGELSDADSPVGHDSSEDAAGSSEARKQQVLLALESLHCMYEVSISQCRV